MKNELLNEPKILTTDLLDEIKPLLEDYFAGKFISDGSGINYLLPNGQQFVICAKER